MIRHIVFFTADGPEKRDLVRAGLQALKRIPGPLVFEVSDNLRIDLYDNGIDIVVYAEFADEAAFNAFKLHPEYPATTAAVRPLRRSRYSADIAVDAEIPRRRGFDHSAWPSRPCGNPRCSICRNLARSRAGALIRLWLEFEWESWNAGKFWLCDPALLHPVVESAFMGDPDYDPDHMDSYAA